jgi:hypothetical protein
MAENPPKVQLNLTKSEIEAVQVYLTTIKTQERYRTARTTIICGTILGGVWIVGDVIVRVMDQPPWLQALTILAGAVIPSGLMWRMVARFRFYMANDHKRRVELEAVVDAARTSSNISPEGVSPHD